MTTQTLSHICVINQTGGDFCWPAVIKWNLKESFYKYFPHVWCLFLNFSLCWLMDLFIVLFISLISMKNVWGFGTFSVTGCVCVSNGEQASLIFFLLSILWLILGLSLTYCFGWRNCWCICQCVMFRVALLSALAWCKQHIQSHKMHDKRAVVFACFVIFPFCFPSTHVEIQTLIPWPTFDSPATALPEGTGEHYCC